MTHLNIVFASLLIAYEFFLVDLNLTLNSLIIYYSPTTTNPNPNPATKFNLKVKQNLHFSLDFTISLYSRE